MHEEYVSRFRTLSEVFNYLTFRGNIELKHAVVRMITVRDCLRYNCSIVKMSFFVVDDICNWEWSLTKIQFLSIVSTDLCNGHGKNVFVYKNIILDLPLWAVQFSEEPCIRHKNTWRVVRESRLYIFLQARNLFRGDAKTFDSAAHWIRFVLAVHFGCVLVFFFFIFCNHILLWYSLTGTFSDAYEYFSWCATDIISWKDTDFVWHELSGLRSVNGAAAWTVAGQEGIGRHISQYCTYCFRQQHFHW